MDMSTTESSLMTATRVDKSAEVTSTTETLIGKSAKETRIVTRTPMEMSVFETRWREHYGSVQVRKQRSNWVEYGISKPKNGVYK
jgi:hypothetical protein